MTTARPFHRAGRVWRVLGYTVDPEGVERRLVLDGFAQDCGHHHETDAEAYACPWEPAVTPATPYAGRVQQVRDDRGDGPARREQGRFPFVVPGWGG